MKFVLVTERCFLPMIAGKTYTNEKTIILMFVSYPPFTFIIISSADEIIMMVIGGDYCIYLVQAKLFQLRSIDSCSLS